MSGEKTEKPTSKKINDAKKEGKIPRSKELASVLILLFATLYFKHFGGTFLSFFNELIHNTWDFSKFLTMDGQDFDIVLFDIAKDTSLVLIPFMFIVMFISIASNSLVGGFSVRLSKLKPDFKKLNPISGFKNMFSKQKLAELVKTALKVLLVAVPIYFKIPDQFVSFKNSVLTLFPNELISSMGKEVMSFVVFTASLFVLVGFVDVPFQIWNHFKGLRMSKQEIKDEYKQSEGNPELKGRRRQVQMEMSRKAGGSKVSQADMLITNPTHYSVGVRYNPDIDDSPVIVSLGADLIALEHRKMAKERNIPILEIPPLARVLYKVCEVNDGVPPALYPQMATIIREIYSLDDRLSFKVTKKFVDSLGVNEDDF
ncbi:flagellar biosynthesis protein FlhB [Photobacterium damselae]|uniref:EscU/YscU/HrcU family type III secretion system export apparatus switch protein n=1 Tax=Photobacterium damselae TaxID=38293 RepID=UPI001F257D64|nr:EscU/YscU/HrcU family type III secretion system export apparatus switch protein [Photobacterium damselae]UKA04608.1 EscU/YscU/HrcU family type III secretion system export apparatus switch protein [Photobacterium damselae subsp. damselae]